jgi:hypothetical protein
VPSSRQDRSDIPPKLPRSMGRDLKAEGLDAPKGKAESVSVPKGSADTFRRVATSGARRPPGLPRRLLAASATRLARRFAEVLTSTYPDAMAWSMTLTERSGAVRELMERGRIYAAAVALKDPSAIGVLAVDRGPATGHAHLHGLIISATADGKALTRAWLHLWRAAKGAGRPLPSHQRSRGPIESSRGRTRVIVKVLVHALDRHAEKEAAARGNLSLRLPMLRERIIMVGESTREVLEAALQGPQKATKPHGQRRKSWSHGKKCCWCGGPYRSRLRRDARYHEGCDRRARRALKMLLLKTQPLIGAWLSKLVHRDEGWFDVRARPDFDTEAFITHPATDAGWHIRHWLGKLESKGWRRPDAVRVIWAAIRQNEWPTLHPLSNPRLKSVLTCQCGQPLKERLNATTCGRPACRARRQRLNSRGDTTRTNGARQ